MAYGRRKDIVLGLKIVVVLGKSTKRARDIGGDGRLFGNYQLLAHEIFLARVGDEVT